MCRQYLSAVGVDSGDRDLPDEECPIRILSRSSLALRGSVPTVFLVDQTSVCAFAISMFMAGKSASVGTGLRQKKCHKAESDPNRCVVSSEDMHSSILEVPYS